MERQTNHTLTLHVFVFSIRLFRLAGRRKHIKHAGVYDIPQFLSRLRFGYPVQALQSL